MKMGISEDKLQIIERAVTSIFAPQSKITSFIFLVIGIQSGCVSGEVTQQSIALDSPRASSGVIVKDGPENPDENDLGVIFSAFNEQVSNYGNLSSEIPVKVTSELRAETLETPPSSKGVWGGDFGQLLNLPRLNYIELEELLDDLALTLSSDLGYSLSDPDRVDGILSLPKNVKGRRLLTRSLEGGIDVIDIGFWTYLSRSPRLGIFGAQIREQKRNLNPDVNTALDATNTTLDAFESMRSSLSIGDLQNHVLQLSYVDMPSALSALKGLGVTTVSSDLPFPTELEFKDLPIVIELKSPSATNIGVVGKSDLTQGKFGSTAMPGQAAELPAETVSSPISRLMTLFHPAHPEQLSRIQSLLNDVIDVPARQVFVEGQIIEIGDSALNELGIQWEFSEGNWNFMLGGLQPGLLDSGDAIANINGAKSAAFSTEIAGKLRALVVEGKGRILSRPSVLTLNGRQATIRIGEDIPIATSQEGITGNANKIAFNFNYLNIGIVLNIRPRISQDGSEISLMVDTIVSDEIPGQGLEIRDGDGDLLASAPRVTSRRVQTYARIQNNTPFILGGLVSRQNITVESKVPVLGSIPYLGRLFRSTNKQENRNEVIIVLTPYILPEEIHLSRVLPKGEEFDSSDTELFRHTHQILAEDIVDIAFLYQNKRFDSYRELAEKVVKKNSRYVEQDPFRNFVSGIVPGAEAIVHEIVFNTLERVNAVRGIQLENVLTLTKQDLKGYQTRKLTDILEIRGSGDDERSFFTDNPGKALALTFADLHDVTGPGELISNPVPQIQILDCPDRSKWKQLLWDMNQPKNDGSKQHTIIINSEEDLERLRLSILLKKVLEINGARQKVEILKFIPGRIIQIPKTNPDQPHVVDAEIAKYFFHSEHFYASAIKEIEDALQSLDSALRHSEIVRLLEGEKPPGL